MFWKKSLLLLTTLNCVDFSLNQITRNGNCPNDIEVLDYFDIEYYLGLWYEQQKYPNSAETGKCITAEYSLMNDGKVEVVNTQTNIFTEVPNSINGYASIVKGAKLKVTFPITRNRNATSNYWILDTDYLTYSVVYSCYEAKPNTHSTVVWILTRQRRPSYTIIVRARDVLQANNIDLSGMVITDQSNCGS